MTAALEGGEWSAARSGRTLPPGKTRYPFYRRLGGTRGRSGRAENLIPTGIRSRTVQPIAQSLYRLSYRAHIIRVYSTIIFTKHSLLERGIFIRIICSAVPRKRYLAFTNGHTCSVDLFSVWESKWKTRVSPSVKSYGELTASGLLATQNGNCQATSWQVVSRRHNECQYK